MLFETFIKNKIMKRKKHIIDPNKLAKTFGIEWKKTNLLVDIKKGDKKESFVFDLREKNKKPSISLIFNYDMPKCIHLNIETKNGYCSSIDFENITKVIYIPQYRAVRLESHTKTHFSILKIYWRGQFDLISNYEEKTYPKTVWAKNKKK